MTSVADDDLARVFIALVVFPPRLNCIPPRVSCETLLNDIANFLGISYERVVEQVPSIVNQCHSVYYGSALAMLRNVYPLVDDVHQAVGSYDLWYSGLRRALQGDIARSTTCTDSSFHGDLSIESLRLSPAVLNMKHVEIHVFMINNQGVDEEVHKCMGSELERSPTMRLTFNVRSKSATLRILIVRKHKQSLSVNRKVDHVFSTDIVIKDMLGISPVWGFCEETRETEFLSLSSTFRFCDWSILKLDNGSRVIDLQSFVIPNMRSAFSFFDAAIEKVVQFLEGSDDVTEIDNHVSQQWVDDHCDVECEVLPPFVQWLLTEFLTRYKVLFSHLEVVFFHALVKRPGLCLQIPDELLPALKRARSFVSRIDQPAADVVLMSDFALYESALKKLHDRLENALNNYKSYPVDVLRGFLSTYEALSCPNGSEDEAQHFLCSLEVHVRLGLMNNYTRLKDESQLSLDNALGLIRLVDKVSHALQADLDVYAVDVFPLELDYLAIVADSVYALLVNDVSMFLRDFQKPDPSLAQFLEAFENLESFWLNNMPSATEKYSVFTFDIAEFARPNVERWLETTRETLRYWVTSAFLIDKFEPMSISEKHSSSLVDSVKLCETIMLVFRTSKYMFELRPRGIRMVCEAMTSYADLIRSKVMEVDEEEKVSMLSRTFNKVSLTVARAGHTLRDFHFAPFLDSTASSEASSQISSQDLARDQQLLDGDNLHGPELFTASELVQINCLCKLLELLLGMMERHLTDAERSEDVLSEADPVTEQDESSSTESNPRSMFFNAQKHITGNLISCVSFVAKPVHLAVLEHCKFIVSFTGPGTAADDGLFDLLDLSLSLASDLLYEDAFKRLVRRSFVECVQAVESFIGGEDEEFQYSGLTASHIQSCLLLLDNLVDFFHADGVHLTTKFIGQSTANVRALCKFAQLSTSLLVELYYKYAESTGENVEYASMIVNILESRRTFDKDARVFVEKASDRYDRRLHKLFDLPKSEQCYARYRCENGGVIQGKMYVTTRYLCWSPLHVTSGQNLMIPLVTIADLTLSGKTLAVLTADEVRYNFSGFEGGKQADAYDDVFVRTSSLGVNVVRQDGQSKKHSSSVGSKIARKFNLAEEEVLIESFPCMVRLAIPSVMYLFSETICFESPIPLVGKQFSIKYDDIFSVKKSLLRALEFRLSDGSELLVTGLLNRDAVFRSFGVRGSVLGLPWRLSAGRDAIFRDENLAKSADAIIEEAKARAENIPRTALQVSMTADFIRESFDLSDSERLFGQWRCSHRGDQGFAYLFSTSLCFETLLFSKGPSRLVLPLANVRMIMKKKNDGDIIGKGVVVLDRDRVEHSFSSVVNRSDFFRSLRTVASEAGAIFLDEVDVDDGVELRHIKMLARLGLSEDENVEAEFSCFSSNYLAGKLYVSTTHLIFDPIVFKTQAYAERYIDIKSMKKCRFMRLSIEFVRYDGSKFQLRGFTQRNEAFACILRRAQILGLDLAAASPTEQLSLRRWERLRSEVVKKFSLPRDEALLGEFHAGVGFLWVTTGHICWDSTLNSGKRGIMRCIAVVDVVEVRPVRKLFGTPLSIVLTLHDGKQEMFSGVIMRDKAVKLIRDRVRDVARAVGTTQNLAQS